MNDKVQETDAHTYLHVMPRHEVGDRQPRWHVFRISDESPRIAPAGSVGTCEEARALASHDKEPLRVAKDAWQQMRTAGVAPAEVPTDVTVA
ncbi:MAG TPA: hypothetical protein VGL39_24935 [Jatrophihabitantaceae bacterium]